MKARFLALAALVLGVVSCQTEPEGLDVNVGGEQLVTINVAVPEAETRAGGSNSALGVFDNGVLGTKEDNTTMRYILQVYYKTMENGEAKYTASKERLVEYSDDKSVAFEVRLVPERDYQFVVWADVVTNGKSDTDNHYNTEDLANIKLNNTWVAMDESRDAFTATELIEDYSGASNINITLKRPFAKVRVVTTDMKALNNLGIVPTKATVEYKIQHYNAFNALFDKAIGDSKNRDIKHENYAIASYGENTAAGADMTLFSDYFFAENDAVQFELKVYDQNGDLIKENAFNTDIYAKRNYLTTIKGNILTDGKGFDVTIDDAFAGESGKEDGKTFANVDTAEELLDAINKGIENITVEDNIDLNDLLTAGTLATRATTDPSLAIKAGEKINIDLGGFTLSATSSQTGKNYDMIDVRGTLSIKNGAIECKHEGNNMEWNNSTNVFNVTAGGVLNLNSVTAKNLGGSDMAFVAHLNNWGEVTLNVDNSTLESTYIAVRVFNSGPDMNNVTIKNSTLKGDKYAFWVHNYTLADFGNNADKTAAQKALLNINIYNQNNTFIPDVDGIIYGFTNTIKSDSYGITKSVSEDGTEVTLGSLFENGIIRRNVAGAEGNNTIKEVVIEEGVGVLYDRTFRRFYALESVTLPSTLTTIGATGTGVFQSCSALKNINIPASVTTIGMGTFYGCRALESIEIPAGVTRIEADCLRETGLKKVVFHEGVTYFGKQAFRDCEDLEEIYINAPSFTIESNTFLNAAAPYPNFTIYVVNTEMKDYLESMFDAHTKTFITVKGPEVVADKEEIKEALDSALADGETNVVIDANGANIGDLDYGLSASKIPAGTTVTIRNAEVSGSSYGNGVDGTVIFEGCTFNNEGGAYSIHFDSGSGDVIFKNCHLYGWNSFGSSLNSVTFENCSLHGNGKYALIRSYVDLTLTDCTIDVSNANHDDVYNEGVQAVNDATLTMTNTKYEASNANGLNYALAAGANKVTLLAGNYELSGLNFVANDVTLKGVDKANVVLNLENSIYLQNKSVTLENLTYNLNAGKGYTEQAFAFVHHATAFNLKNCNVNRLRLNVYEANIEDCTFTLNTSSGFDGYCIYYYGNDNSTVNVKNSTFATAGKCICIYSESAKAYNLNVDKCSFTSSDSATDKAAIQMHTELGISGNVKITETTATGFADINGGLWNELNNNTKVATDKFDIWVDGTQVH